MLLLPLLHAAATVSISPACRTHSPHACMHAHVMAILAPSLRLLSALCISMRTGLVMAMLSPLPSEAEAVPAGVLLPKMKPAIFLKPALDASRMVPRTASVKERQVQ